MKPINQRSLNVQECLGSSHKPLGLGNLLGIFIYLAIGLLLSTVILVMELFLRSEKSISSSYNICF